MKKLALVMALVPIVALGCSNSGSKTGSSEENSKQQTHSVNQYSTQWEDLGPDIKGKFKIEGTVSKLSYPDGQSPMILIRDSKEPDPDEGVGCSFQDFDSIKAVRPGQEVTLVGDADSTALYPMLQNCTIQDIRGTPYGEFDVKEFCDHAQANDRDTKSYQVSGQIESIRKLKDLIGDEVVLVKFKAEKIVYAQFDKYSFPLSKLASLKENDEIVVVGQRLPLTTLPKDIERADASLDGCVLIE